jgi:hypothetical protein
MEDFIEDENSLRPDSIKFAVFRRVLDENEKHPNRAYFVLKSIIVNNLFGVDIMPDAVEICKLRLFLSLVAQVDADANKKNYGLEPLPDIDFNIRAGNTLVGFANETEVYQAFQGVTQARLAFDDRADDFKWKAEETAKIYEHFRLQQIKEGGEIKPEDKANLQTKLRELSDELDKFIAHEYGIDEIKKPKQFADFLVSHQPFHWYSEFFGIIAGGGFDVIIGNPPYVEISPRNINYKLPMNFQTLECGNLYAVVTERCSGLISSKGRFAFIIPSSSCCTPRMIPLMNTLVANYEEQWISIYDERPGKLFNGVDQQLCIQIGKAGEQNKRLWITPMRHWVTSPFDERENLFALTNYSQVSFEKRIAEVLPKIGSSLEIKLFQKLFEVENVPFTNLSVSDQIQPIYYRNAGGRYWKLVKSFPSFFQSEDGRRSSTTELTLAVGAKMIPVLVSLYSSTLFYWFWRTVSNCRHLTNREFLAFPIAKSLFENNSQGNFEKLVSAYENKLQETAVRKTIQNSNSGKVVQDEYRANTAKPIIDEIDRVLAKHYGFTDEELDFIINYDIKYRMGRED